MHHPSTDSQSLEERNVGRSLSQLELVYKTTTIRLKKYLDTKADWMLQLVNRFKKLVKNYAANKESNKFAI